MNRRHTFQMILLALLAALTLLPACTSLFGVELSNGGDYSPFALRITAHHQSSPCAKAGEPIQIRFTVTNYSQQPFVVASNLPIIEIIVQESAGMNPVYSWATQNPEKVEPRLEWRPGESKVIELSWSVPQKEYVPGHAAVIGGMLSEDGKVVYSVPVSVCLGIPFEPR